MSSRNGPMKMTSPRGTHQIRSRVVPIVAMDQNDNKESSLDVATRQETSTITTFCRIIARSIAHAWKQAAPHRNVLPLNANSTVTLLHDNNTVENQCWTSTTTSFVPRTELRSSTNNTTMTTNAAGHVLAIMEALPPPPYKWMVVLEHESPEAVVWSNGFARRCRNGAIRVPVSWLSWNRPTIWLAYHTDRVECGSLRSLV